jgi:metallo-beta-lactamase class B
MRIEIRILLAAAGAYLVPITAAHAQRADSAAVGYSPNACPSCVEWNAPTAPVHLFGNVYYVGTRGLSAILLTSDSGHILLDAGLPESAAPIMANVRALGFRVEDIRVIVNSHPHYDHAGGIAAIQRASRARVAATLSSALVLHSGTAGVDDPQHDVALPFPRLAGTEIRVLADGDTVRVGPAAITAYLTAGHTPGGTSWSWRSCEGTTCLDFVYADSQTPVSADGFLFTRNTTYPTALADFARGFAVLEQLPCDVLLTPHPGASQLWERLERRDRGEKDALRDPQACRRYAANARAQLARRVVAESAR